MQAAQVYEIDDKLWFVVETEGEVEIWEIPPLDDEGED